MAGFGPDRTACWQKFAREIGGAYIPASYIRQERIQTKVDEWTVTIDSYTETAGENTANFTRMRSPCRNPARVHFVVHRRNLLEEVGTMFGHYDIVVGDPPFDDAFVVTGTEPDATAKLFQDEPIRQMLENQQDIYLEVRDAFDSYGTPLPRGCDELYVRVDGAINDPARLRELLDLYKAVVQRLSNL